MPLVRLPDRAVITVSGADAERLLQNVITTDLDALNEGEAKPGALLTPQGKIMFDFVISRAGPEALRLDCRTDIAADFARRLVLYRLRAKAQIVVQEQADVTVVWQNESAPSETDSGAYGAAQSVLDTRFKDVAVSRIYDSGELPEGVPLAIWTLLRIQHGAAESGTDYALGDAFPHDVLFDENGGVGFRKGCYVGQEVVSRMQHRGTARRRVMIVAGSAPLPASGTAIGANGRDIGTLGSVDGDNGLAIVRIDRVKDALDAGIQIVAGDVDVTLAIPSWAKFNLPASTEVESA